MPRRVLTRAQRSRIRFDEEKGNPARFYALRHSIQLEPVSRNRSVALFAVPELAYDNVRVAVKLELHSSSAALTTKLLPPGDDTVVDCDFSTPSNDAHERLLEIIFGAEDSPVPAPGTVVMPFIGKAEYTFSGKTGVFTAEVGAVAGSREECAEFFKKRQKDERPHAAGKSGGGSASAPDKDAWELVSADEE